MRYFMEKEVFALNAAENVKRLPSVILGVSAAFAAVGLSALPR